MNDIKLKPCPFCGGEATVVHDKDWLRIACKTKGCEVAPSTGFHKTLKVAADVWNDRAPDEQPIEVKQFLTPEEVRKMAPREVKENYDLILQSMRRW